MIDTSSCAYVSSGFSIATRSTFLLCSLNANGIIVYFLRMFTGTSFVTPLSILIFCKSTISIFNCLLSAAAISSSVRMPSSTRISPNFLFLSFCFFSARSSCSCVILPVSTSKSPRRIFFLLKSMTFHVLFLRSTMISIPISLLNCNHFTNKTPCTSGQNSEVRLSDL